MKKHQVTPAAPLHRSDGAGHLDPHYAAGLHARSQESARPKEIGGYSQKALHHDATAERAGESFIETATSGEDSEPDVVDGVVIEDEGGPFVETTGEAEFATGTDESNPPEAFREPFPMT